MFHSINARALEIHLAIVEAIRLLEAPPPPQAAPVIEPKAGTGFGCTEAPRGILWHRYELDDEGRVKQARIVPPTSQNQARIEEDLRLSLQHFGLQREEAELRLHAEKVIRNYDPCISCATHFLQLDVQHLDQKTPELKTDTATKIKVIGIGSPQDADRLGWQVVQILEQDEQLQEFMPRRLSFITLDRPGSRLLEHLQDSEVIFLIDCLNSHNPARRNQVTELRAEDLAKDGTLLSSHDLGLGEALSLYLAMEHDRTKPEILIAGLDVGGDTCQPFNQQAVMGLSLKLKEKILSLLEAIQ